jgi:hypothetical protein
MPIYLSFFTGAATLSFAIVAETVSSTTWNSDAGTVSPSSSALDTLSEFLETQEIKHTDIAMQKKTTDENIIRFFIFLL